MPRKQPPFWDRVDKSGDCWLWTGPRRPDGYGLVSVAGRVRSSHRLAWKLTNGRIPANRVVMHKCDNPPCVRPDHLMLGTVLENNRDRHSKGRSRGLFAGGPDHPATRRRGEAHWMAKLSARQVRKIRKLRAEGRKTTELGEMFSVHPATISRICRGEWRSEVQ